VHERVDVVGARLTAAFVGGSPEDFLPAWNAEPPPEQEPDQMIAFLRSLQGDKPRKRKRRKRATTKRS
jgi:hypothetical protein